MDNPTRWKPGTYIDSIVDSFGRNSHITCMDGMTSITPNSTGSVNVEQVKFESNIENDIVGEIFRHEDMIVDEYDHLASEGNSLNFGSLKAGDNGADYDDDALLSDLYVSSTSDSDSESDNESKIVIDDRTSWQRGTKRREHKSGLPGRFKRQKIHNDSDDSGSDVSESDSDKVDTCLVAQNEITFNDDDSDNSDSDSYDRDHLNNSSTISSFPHFGNNKKETGASKTAEDKSGLPGRFKRLKIHNDSDDSDDSGSDESESDSDKVDTSVVPQNEINSSDDDTEDSDSDSFDKNDSNISSIGSNASQCGNYKKKTSASETRYKLGDSSDMTNISDDSPIQPFEKLNTIVSVDNDDYRLSELVSTYDKEQPDTDVLDIMVNEDEDNFTDFSDSDYSDDEDSSDNSSDEETEKVLTAGRRLPLIPRRMSVLPPLRMILLKYRMIRNAKKYRLSCCHLSCWRDWPILKIIKAMFDYEL
ncbi:hypothetical protein ACJMK2_012075 [Sinanodonta woodiana]|uniref:Dentin sialophosphoprotein n=1 Tax=Sinanodonta woodiana TaxID=1069815 RepID=A0ABD3V7D0_SINWO